MQYEYKPPEFLQNQTVDEIHGRMLDNLPSDIDKSEMQIPWDFTRPAAMEKAEFVEYELNEVIKTMFPQWAAGEWLDLHAEMNGVSRRLATCATGFLTVFGTEGTLVEKGFEAATTATLTPGVIFQTTEDLTLGKGPYMLKNTEGKEVLELLLNDPENPGYLLTIRPVTDNINQGELILSHGTEEMERFTFDRSVESEQVTSLFNAASGSNYFTLTEKVVGNAVPLQAIERAPVGNIVRIQAAEDGINGNVLPDTITNMLTVIPGLSAVTNVEATTGGIPEEEDDVLRDRIIESARYGVSFSGCEADYIRWAKEIPGVGSVICEHKEEEPGSVFLYVMDVNGQPASKEIRDAVEKHIMGTKENPEERLAPIGARLSVPEPETVTINVCANVRRKGEESLDVIKKRFEENLAKYLKTATLERLVKYVYVGAVLAGTEGIDNYNGLIVNDGTSDVIIDSTQFTVAQVTLIEVT